MNPRDVPAEGSNIGPNIGEPPLPDFTWPALAASWAVLARASVKLPDDADGWRWRGAVPSIITLQAVTLALGELVKACDDQSPLHCDRAGHLIADHAAKLDRLWQTAPLPPALGELVGDARAQLALARSRLSPDAVRPSGP